MLIMVTMMMNSLKIVGSKQIQNAAAMVSRATKQRNWKMKKVMKMSIESTVLHRTVMMTLNQERKDTIVFRTSQSTRLTS
jgi:hypothetical protein